MIEKIYGLEYEEHTDGERIRWNILLHHPFRDADGNLKIGLNEKFLKTAIKKGVDKFILGDRIIPVPTEKNLKTMIKQGQFKLQPSIFTGREPYRIYFFRI